MRNGKIAKLPESIREQLNQRMENDDDGPALLDWLNGLPETRQTLQDGFQGAPITRQNLCEWRQGGFREWQLRHQFIGQAQDLSNAAGDLDKTLGACPLPGALVSMLATRYAAVLNSWDGEPDPKLEEKLRLLRSLARDVALIQRTSHQAARQEAEQRQRQEEERQRETKERKAKIIAPIMALMMQKACAGTLGGDTWAVMVGALLAATQYDQPVDNYFPADLPLRLSEVSPKDLVTLYFQERFFQDFGEYLVAKKPAPSNPVAPEEHPEGGAPRRPDVAQSPSNPVAPEEDPAQAEPDSGMGIDGKHGSVAPDEDPGQTPSNPVAPEDHPEGGAPRRPDEDLSQTQPSQVGVAELRPPEGPAKEDQAQSNPVAPKVAFDPSHSSPWSLSHRLMLGDSVARVRS